MAEQTTSTGTYQSPYKFNGKELDAETGLYYYGARYYDPKSSVWLSVDPLAEKNPGLSPYNYCTNNPINAIDPDGRKIIFVVYQNNKSLQYIYRNGNFYFDGKRYNPSIESVSKSMYRVLAVYRKIEKSNDKDLKAILHTLEKSETKHYIYSNSDGENSVHPEYKSEIDPKTHNNINGKLDFTQTQFALDDKDGADFIGIGETDMTTVIHEMRHEFDYEIGNMTDDTDLHNQDNPAEIRAVHLENKARDIEHLKHRTKYGGIIVPNKLKSPPNNKMPEQ